jgi:hypothetical protein
LKYSGDLNLQIKRFISEFFLFFSGTGTSRLGLPQQCQSGNGLSIYTLIKLSNPRTMRLPVKPLRIKKAGYSPAFLVF